LTATSAGITTGHLHARNQAWKYLVFVSHKPTTHFRISVFHTQLTKEIIMNKTTATTAPEIQTAEADPIRTLKTANCPSLSERSTLTYKVGSNTEGAIQFRVCANTGSGFFNDEWVSLQDVQDVVDAVPVGMPITSSTFRSIYAGKSNNSSGFLLAVMKHLGLILFPLR
jgi:hypothetical protein